MIVWINDGIGWIQKGEDSLDHVIDKKAINALQRAIKHAKGVARREHIKATTTHDRHERVGIFVTSLRSELVGSWHEFSSNNSLRSLLCDKRNWFDIGIIELRHMYSRNIGGMMVDVNRVAAWLQAASSGAEDDFIGEIEEDLESVKADLSWFRNHLTRADGIDRTASNLVSNIEKAVQEAA